MRHPREPLPAILREGLPVAKGMLAFDVALSGYRSGVPLRRAGAEGGGASAVTDPGFGEAPD
jgi:hypothetical protein